MNLRFTLVRNTVAVQVQAGSILDVALIANAVGLAIAGQLFRDGDGRVKDGVSTKHKVGIFYIVGPRPRIRI